MARNSVAGLERFVEGFEKYPYWVGIDVHKRSYWVALRRADGKAHTVVTPASPERLTELFGRLGLRVEVVAYEAGPTGFSLARKLKASGIGVIVAAPSKIARPVGAGAKCDRLDCLKLAEYAFKGMLKSIAVPTEGEEARRALIRRRHTLADAVRKCKQRIKGQLLYLGIEEPKGLARWSAEGIEALSSLPMGLGARLALESLLRELSSQTAELRRVEVEIKQLTKNEGQAQSLAYLQSVPGVGAVVATTFALELYNPERFKRAEEVAGYLGLAPVVRQSGEKKGTGRLVPVGQKRLRSLLVEAAWVWKTKDRHAAELYNRLFSRTGVAQKAIVGVARNLAVILWRLYVEQRPYRPATN